MGLIAEYLRHTLAMSNLLLFGIGVAFGTMAYRLTKDLLARIRRRP